MLAGLSTDVSFWLRDASFGPRRTAAQSSIAVVLIDEATYASADFRNTPKEMWTPQIGAVLDAVNQAGPRAVGFDIILPTTLGTLKPDYDVPFQLALRHLARAHRIVLSKFQSNGAPLVPFRAFTLAAGGSGNLRSINLIEDPDGIVRRVPLLLSTANPAQPREPSFSLDLARRAEPTLPAPPGDDALMLNFDGGNPFPTYSFVDVVACAAQGNTAFFDQAFKDRTVLIGTSLDVEDRQLTSRRLINPPEQANIDHCIPQSPPPRTQFARPTLPGVFIHATAIDNLLRGEALRPLDLPARMAAIAGPTMIAGALAWTVPLSLGVAGLVGLAALTAGGATLLFQHAIATPLVEAVLAAILGFMLLLGFRLLVTDRDKRLIRQIFGLYLAPSVIGPMLAANRLPALGGERRELTFLFSDVAGFTTVTEATDPAHLAPVLNAYFDGVCQAVMQHGGLVVEFLGDGVMALFGAPDIQPDHAARAVACARAIDAFTESYRAAGPAAAIGFGHTRIGVHTGEALVGNFGATKRLKYAALGDVVNATSRIEGLNKFFGTRICISGVTQRASGDPDVRAIGDFLLKGKSQPITVFEVLAPGSADHPHIQSWQKAYARLSDGDASVADLLRDLAQARPDDPCITFHLGRLDGGTVGTTIVMTEK